MFLEFKIYMLFFGIPITQNRGPNIALQLKPSLSPFFFIYQLGCQITSISEFHEVFCTFHTIFLLYLSAIYIYFNSLHIVINCWQTDIWVATL